MSKALKKLLCALMALAVVFAFAACGDKDKKDEDKKEETKTEEKADKKADDEAEVEEEAEEEEEGITEKAVKKAAEAYVNDTLAVLSEDAALEAMAEEFATLIMGDSYDDSYVEAFIPAAKSYVKVMLKNIDVEVVDWTEEEAEIIISMPNVENFEALGEALGEEMLTTGVVTEDMTTDEMVKAIVDYLSGAWDGLVAQAGTAESNVTLTLTMEDGKLVATEK